MNKQYRFGKNNDWEEDFLYAYSLEAKTHTEFDVEEDCVVNRYNAEQKTNSFPYDYISMVTKKKYSGNVRIKTQCLFESFGAPLIVFSDDITNQDGVNYYGAHFEIVAYERGLNIWYIIPNNDPEAQRRIKTAKIAFLDFPVEENTRLDLEVTIQGKTITARMAGQELSVSHEKIPERFHVGITACEGVNRFYSFEIEKQVQ